MLFFKRQWQKEYNMNTQSTLSQTQDDTEDGKNRKKHKTHKLNYIFIIRIINQIQRTFGRYRCLLLLLKKDLCGTIIQIMLCPYEVSRKHQPCEFFLFNSSLSYFFFLLLLLFLCFYAAPCCAPINVLGSYAPEHVFF